MNATEAYEKFNDMPVSEAILVAVGFGKQKGSTVGSLSYRYAEWVQENITGSYFHEEMFKTLYAISNIMKCDNLLVPDDPEMDLKTCLKLGGYK